MVQQQELTMTERELDEMSSQLRMAMSGLAPGGVSADTAAAREVDAFLADDAIGADKGDASAATFDDDDDLVGGSPPLGRATGGTSSVGGAARRTRAEREAEAEERLAALKRRMGK